MEAIREYLNNLFMSLPETPEVLRAKAALLEMMEDKYDELISDGKSEKEAVGTVISEFGNLEELAEELGIERYLKREENAEESSNTAASRKTGNYQRPPKKQYEWTFNDARDYLKYAWRHAACIAFGVALCIWSPYPDSILDAAAEAAGYVPEGVAATLGGVLLFFMVAAAVVLFCFAAHMRKQYGNVARYGISLDEKASRFVVQKRETDEKTRLWMRITGIVLCIISVVPSSINYVGNIVIQEMLDSSVLVFVGVGVCLIVMSASTGNRYKELIKALRNGTGRAEEWSGMYRNGHGKAGTAAAAIIIIIVVFVVVMFSILIGFLSFGNGSQSVKTMEGRYAVADVQEIRVELDICEVSVERAAVEEIQYQYNGTDERYTPQVTINNGVLRISEQEIRGWAGFHFHLFNWGNRVGRRDVTVLIPESANVMQTDGLRYVLDVDAGNVILNGINASGLKLDVDAGNVEGENCFFGGKSSIDVDAGNVEFTQTAFANLQADVDAGAFFCTESPIPLACYELDFDVDLGDLSVNGEGRGGSYKSKPEQEAVDKYANRFPMTDSYRMAVEVDLGDITVSED